MHFLILFYSFLFASEDLHWMKINADTKFERSVVANTGAVIETVRDDYIIALGLKSEKDQIEEMGMLETSFVLNQKAYFDFPGRDSKFHNYEEVIEELEAIRDLRPDIVEIEKIGTSVEGRDLVNIRISSDLENAHQKPAIAFMGTHHAREHLSTEMPLMLARYLVENYGKIERITRLVEGRDINIIPMVNPDGVEFDIKDGRYKSWRKNRTPNNDGSYGVDLNRNYGFKWGTGGSSTNPRSDVYMGTKPFSEPETKAIKDFVEAKENITILLSFHTFSELILYPWGHTYDSIQDNQSFLVHKTMAETMAKWNNYTPQQSSDLYITSGDTTDWSYGKEGIVSFTFELDPSSIWEGGFYPGQELIQPVFEKNLEPCLYLINLADNPYRVLQPKNPLFESRYF